MTCERTSRLGAALGTVAAVALCLALPRAQSEGDNHWVAAWSTTVQAPRHMAYDPNDGLPRGLDAQTMRVAVPVTIGGRSIRIRLTNAFGDQAVTFQSASVGFQDSNASVVRDSLRPLSFGGRPHVTIAEGAVAWSDPVALPVKAGQAITVSLFSERATGPSSGDFGSGPGGHATPVTFLAAGNATGDVSGTPFSGKARGAYFIHGIDVLAPASVQGAIVTMGDSLTAGATAWPSILGRRVLEAGGRFSVLNTGSGGNRLLGTSRCFGASAQSRLVMDVLEQPGVKALIVFIGINDILQPDIAKTESMPKQVRDCVSREITTADDMIAGYRQISTRAHAHGVKVFAATLMPYKGNPAWTERGEATRAAVNRWIRTSGEFDGVIDFESVIADKQDPGRMSAVAGARDGLHPGPAGHKMLGESVPLSLFAAIRR